MTRARLVMEFPDQATKERFIGGLLDGWGESAPIPVEWAHGGSRPDGSSIVPAQEAEVFQVQCWEEE